ncbi:MAG: hypothetical protein PHD29_04665 [bacterium]|nr:hypothetical protein [bacterium]MDD5756248.1 hypothetical protein [bacterium]
MKQFKMEENIIGLLFALIFALIHYFFVVRAMYFPPVKGLPLDFGVYPFDAPLILVYNLFIKKASLSFYRGFFTLFGTLMYLAIGAFIGSLFDRLLKKIKEEEEKEKEEIRL